MIGKAKNATLWFCLDRTLLVMYTKANTFGYGSTVFVFSSWLQTEACTTGMRGLNSIEDTRDHKACREVIHIYAHYEFLP